MPRQKEEIMKHKKAIIPRIIKKNGTPGEKSAEISMEKQEENAVPYFFPAEGRLIFSSSHNI
jgi:hypothetical protein